MGSISGWEIKSHKWHGVMGKINKKEERKKERKKKHEKISPRRKLTNEMTTGEIFLRLLSGQQGRNKSPTQLSKTTVLCSFWPET